MRYVVEIEDGWQGLELKPLKIVRVYEKRDGWPTKRQKPLISLGSTENTLVGAANQLRLYFLSDTESIDAHECGVLCPTHGDPRDTSMDLGRLAEGKLT